MATKPDEQLADVVQLPVQPRTCDSCLNVLMGPRGSYCGAFNEMIADERIAQECEEYES